MPTVVIDALPRAVLFDMDDTLVATSVASRAALRIIADRVADTIARSRPEIRAALQAAHDWYWSDVARRAHARLHQAQARTAMLDRVLAGLSVSSGVDTEALGRAFVSERLSLLDPIPGAFETLRELRERGVRTALITNGSGPQQRDKIDRHHIGRLVDFVAVEGELGFGKPDPRIFTLALDHLDATPSQAWMVGDDLHWDIGGAQAVGIHSVWVRGHASVTAAPIEPDRSVERVADLLDLDAPTA